MNRLLALFILLSGLLVGNLALADFQKGIVAHNKGDYATAFREWTPLAEQGDVRAQYNLGQMYKNGQGVTQNYKTAIRWFKLSAEQGNTSAQFNLGVMYTKGQGVSIIPEEPLGRVKQGILAVF
jgi:hypothetical protein